jgi:hypothetical protein
MILHLSDSDDQLGWIRCVWDGVTKQKGDGFIRRIAYGVPTFELYDGIYQIHDPEETPMRYGFLIQDGKGSRFNPKLMSRVYADVTGEPLMDNTARRASVSTASKICRLDVYDNPAPCRSCGEQVTIVYLPESVCVGCYEGVQHA